jgi:hypothetical protein
MRFASARRLTPPPVVVVSRGPMGGLQERHIVLLLHNSRTIRPRRIRRDSLARKQLGTLGNQSSERIRCPPGGRKPERLPADGTPPTPLYSIPAGSRPELVRI